MAISIFLDTSIYENSNFSFSNRQFSKLKELAEKNEVVLLYNDIVYQEVKQHIRENVSEATSKFNQVIEENRTFIGIGIGIGYSWKCSIFEIQVYVGR